MGILCQLYVPFGLETRSTFPGSREYTTFEIIGLNGRTIQNSGKTAHHYELDLAVIQFS